MTISHIPAVSRFADPGAKQSASSVRRRLRQIWSRMWLVMAFTALGACVAALAAAHQSTLYQGQSSLVISSPGRAPDQDAVIAQGYVALFNDPGVNSRLRSASDIAPDVKLEAQTAANSPILTVTATTRDPKTAQDAAERMAGAFRDDVNSVREAGVSDAIKDVSRQLNQALATRSPEALPDPLVAALSERINAMRSDTTNQLLDLLPRAGVTADSPRPVLHTGLGALSGLILGVLAALAVATVSTRLSNLDDVREKTGVEPLVEVPAGGTMESNSVRGERLRALANLIRLQNLPKPTTVVLTSAGSPRPPSPLAADLARLWARQGYRTVLIGAYGAGPGLLPQAGFLEALTNSTLVHSLLRDTELTTLKILPTGHPVDGHSLSITHERVSAVFDELREVADVIVSAAPAVTKVGDAQLICAAADFAVLVITKNATRATEVSTSAETLENAHVAVFGAVLVEGADAETMLRDPVSSGRHQ